MTRLRSARHRTPCRVSVCAYKRTTPRACSFKRGYKNVINKGIELNEAGEHCELMMETSGHGALKQNHYLDDGAYMAVKIIIEAARRRHQGRPGIRCAQTGTHCASWCCSASCARIVHRVCNVPFGRAAARQGVIHAGQLHQALRLQLFS